MDRSKFSIELTNRLVGGRDLKYYIFDWDDNVLHMPTYIHLERRLADGTWVPHVVSTALFSVIRSDTKNYRPPNGDWEKAFCEFRDFATDDESKFLKDARTAIKRLMSGDDKPPPSFETFKRTLVEGRIFAIVTARGHSQQTLRKGVELFIDTVLSEREKMEMIGNLRGYVAWYESDAANESRNDGKILDDYLALNRYHAVTSPEFRRLVEGRLPDPEKSEARKQFAILDFLHHIFHIFERMDWRDMPRKPISVGFSDDDPANVRAVEEYFYDQLSRLYPTVKFVVYDTSDPTIVKGRKVVVSGQLDLFDSGKSLDPFFK